MAVSDIPVAPTTSTAAGLARLAGTLLCLATAAVVVATLRLGVYEYFHGEGRVFRWMWNALF